jgi:glutamate synthase domain-containing protein 2
VPFSRQQRSLAYQRSLVYQRSKAEPEKRPFGTQKNVMAAGDEWINHSRQPSTTASHDFCTTLGGERCRQPYSASLFNISAMSFGALSANAIRALNGGAQRGGFAHDTGKGSISVHHRADGGWWWSTRPRG